MWDAWAAYDDVAVPVIANERQSVGVATSNGDQTAADRDEAIAYAAYRLLGHRYRNSPGAAESMESFDVIMKTLGYDRKMTAVTGNSPAAVGNRIAAAVIEFGRTDGAYEEEEYIHFDSGYRPVNEPMVVADAGTGPLQDPNHWQPLQLSVSIDQAGRELPDGTQIYLGPHWGSVTPFALPEIGKGMLHYDPGPPPVLEGETRAEYQDVFLEVLRIGTMLSPDDGVMIDISPAARGANSLGANDGTGHSVNPFTGMPYEPNLVKRGDWARVISEFWADGPDSETPPGHWNVLANRVTDHPVNERRLQGKGAPLDPLEWDVKLYLALNGALHDAAIAAWGIKAHYDYVRPITAIRYMASCGQSSWKKV
jgi:hypothetical protein